MADKEQNKLLQLQAEATERLNKALREQKIAHEALDPQSSDYINHLAEFERLSEVAAEAQIQHTKSIELLKTLYPEATAAIEATTAALKDATESAEQLITPFGKMIGLASEFDETLAGTVNSILQTGDATTILNDQFKKTFGLTNLAAAGLEQVVKGSINLTIAQDKALASFAKNGGNVEKYGKELMDLEQAMFTAGISVEEAGESFLSLNRDFTDLRNLSPAVRTDLAKTTAVLNELGISSDVTAENLQFMTKALGVSALQAAETQRELFVLARTIDMPPEAMATAFQDAMPKLAAFGSESTEVFKKLQVNARAAGMEVSDILSIVEQFDTFDTAAASVGRMNAILGGPFLDSLEMVTTTDPTERMRLLSDAVNDAGLSFDEMSYYQRKAIADTMGMDIPQLAMMMANGFDAAVPAAAQSQAQIIALAEEAKNFQTVMDELAQTGRMLAQSMMPIVKTLKWVLNGIQMLTEEFPILNQMLPAIAFGVTGVYLATQKLGMSLAKAGPLGVAIAGMTLLMMAFQAESLGMKVLLGALAVAFVAASIAIAGGFTTINVASMGVVPALGLLATLVLSIANIFMHEAASPGFIDILGLVGNAFKTLGMFMFPVIGIFGMLSSAIMGSAKAAHDLDGTSVEMTTNTKATASSRTSGAISSNAVSVGGTTANKSSGRISSANATAANSIADRYYPQNQDPQSIDVNLLVKQDDKSLVKCIVEVEEQSKHYSNAGMKANPASIRNRLSR